MCLLTSATSSAKVKTANEEGERVMGFRNVAKYKEDKMIAYIQGGVVRWDRGKRYWLIIEPKERKGEILPNGTWVSKVPVDEIGRMFPKKKKDAIYKKTDKNIKITDPKTVLGKRAATIQKGAQIRGIEFKLTSEQIDEISQRPCEYCGEPPTHRYKSGYIGNGIDRIDSDEGYIIENSQACCVECNIFKGRMQHEEFINRIQKIAKHIIEQSKMND